jgi:hypothetical protein
MLRRSLLALSALALAAPAFAQSAWPTRPVKIVVPAPAGSSVEKFYFTVHDDAVAKDVAAATGKRVTLHYEEKVGLPTTCFGETRHFVTKGTATTDIPIGPGVVVQTPAAPPTPAASVPVAPSAPAAPAPAASQ